MCYCTYTVIDIPGFYMVLYLLFQGFSLQWINTVNSTAWSSSSFLNPARFGLGCNMYLRYVGYNMVFTPAPYSLSHGSIKGVFAHLGHTATIWATCTPRQGTLRGSGRHDLVGNTVHTVTGAVSRIPRALSSLPRLLCIWIPVPHTRGY